MEFSHINLISLVEYFPNIYKWQKTSTTPSAYIFDFGWFYRRHPLKKTHYILKIWICLFANRGSVFK